MDSQKARLKPSNNEQEPNGRLSASLHACLELLCGRLRQERRVAPTLATELPLSGALMSNLAT